MSVLAAASAVATVCERQVRRAAAHLFADRGHEGVTPRAIADVLGVSPMTPYRYIPRPF